MKRGTGGAALQGSWQRPQLSVRIQAKAAEKKILAYQRRLARNKEWQAANQDAYRAYKAQWYAANKEKLRTGQGSCSINQRKVATAPRE